MKRIIMAAIIPALSFSYMTPFQKELTATFKNDHGTDNSENQYVQNYTSNKNGSSPSQEIFLEENIFQLFETHRGSGYETNTGGDLAKKIEGKAFDLVGTRKKIEEDKRKEQEKIDAAASIKSELESVKTFHASGYCVVPNEVEVNTISAYTVLSCDLNGIAKKVELTAMLVPDFYSGALVAKPLYFNHNNMRLRSAKGVILNADRTSLNIANVINDRKVEKIVANFAYNTANIVTVQAQAYLDADSQARTTEDVVSTSSGSGGTTVTKGTNTTSPDLGIFVANAGIQMVSNLAKLISEANINSIKYSFKVNQGSILYVDSIITNDQNILDINVNTTEIVNKNNNSLNIQSEANIFDESKNAKQITIENSKQK